MPPKLVNRESVNEKSLGAKAAFFFSEYHNDQNDYQARI